METEESFIDKNVIGDLISSAINNNRKNQFVDCSIYDEDEMVMHLPHPSDCNKFFKCQSGRPVGKKVHKYFMIFIFYEDLLQPSKKT